MNKRANRIRKIACGLVMAYAGLILAWAAAYKLVGDGFWLLAVANSFAIYLFAPLPLVALLTLVARRPTARVALLMPSLVFFGLFGQDLVPATPIVHARDDSPALTVMTYNVLYVNTDAGPMAASIEDTAPDLVAFQELTPLLAEQLEQQVGSHYPYRTPLHPDRCHAEVAIWSRYPLRVEEIDPEVTCRVRPAVVDFEGQAIRVVSIHAWPYTGLDRESVERSFRWRQEQVALVLDRFAGQPEPLVLLGDLNSTPMHEVYQALSAHLVDAYREAGWGLGHTFPATKGRAWGFPYPSRMIRIDHVFHSGHWRADSARVGAWDGASDHRPVVARLRLLK